MNNASQVKKKTVYTGVNSNEKQLTDKNTIVSNELLQFSQLVSHYLRSPIVKIKSIMNHIKTDEVFNGNEAAQSLFDHVSDEAEKLDEIIYDLNKILEVYSKHELKKYVNFKKKLAETCALLENEIRESGAILRFEFSDARGAFTVKEYVLHLLRKLISNAIKYRSHNRQLIITINSFDEGNFTCLMINDNGLGIDLKKYRTKVFGLYNRFHDHVKGKGTGLHLVKAETESLGGNIQLESEVDVGTTFKIYFPKF